MATQPTPTERYQGTIARAVEIYANRTKQRGELWAKFDWREHLRQIESKVARLRMIEELGREPNAEDLDEFLDIINYAGFGVVTMENELT